MINDKTVTILGALLETSARATNAQTVAAEETLFPKGSPLINAVEEEVYSIESSYWKFARAKNALLWT